MGALPRRAASLLLLIRCAAAIPTLNQPLNDRQYWRGSSLESVTPSTSAAAARHRGHHADKPALRRRRRDPTWLALRGGAVDATAASATSGAAATKKKKKKKKKAKAKKQATPSAAAAAADAGGGAAARAAAPYKIDPTGTPLAAKAARLASVPLLVRLQARYAEVVAGNAMLPLYLQLGSTLLFSKAIGKLDQDDDRIKTLTRFIYLGYLVFAQLALALVRARVLAADDATVVTLPPNPMLRKLAELGATKTQLPLPTLLDSMGTSRTTTKEYDLARAKKLRVSYVFPALVVAFLHLKRGQLQAPLLGAAMGLKALLLDEPLVQIHLLGRAATGPSRARPFVPPEPVWGKVLKEKHEKVQQQRAALAEQQRTAAGAAGAAASPRVTLERAPPRREGVNGLLPAEFEVDDEWEPPADDDDDAGAGADAGDASGEEAAAEGEAAEVAAEEGEASGDSDDPASDDDEAAEKGTAAGASSADGLDTVGAA